MELEPTFLNSQHLNNDGVISSWHTNIYFQDNFIVDNWDFDKIIVLPPKFPGSLRFELELNFNDREPLANDTKYLKLFQQIKTTCVNGFRAIIEDKLNYSIEHVEDQNRPYSIVFNLNCNVCTVNKVQTLLEEPIKKFNHLGNEIKIVNLTKVKILADFYFHQATFNDLEYDDTVYQMIKSHMNEYLASLFLSQLEINFPICFSKYIREYLSANILEYPQISFILSNSSKLIPYLITILKNDNNFKTIFKILTYKSKKVKDNEEMFLKFLCD
ncbi:hypothetical protein TPHA_0F00900 [Tetrapisispora phaffii CBS 4417]|uniref:Uncharacterized protein n=1 Tax=Tetrapisispora phaffii (strain ATCC 24235 / CBS 4417 / NBRC 1672 / NRRL Y-8282 / UCD 70-5) TaxID=1071381 RepID=G8BUZ4_TETPH|nr:hypothetical protein TPHA_0F00900 [Tetrapisispora phaffii CBS 4417]CCE63576.1 hypothetical protein TPHA_0F00900 [Tetrapisispora phaffii CBS 4417]